MRNLLVGFLSLMMLPALNVYAEDDVKIIIDGEEMVQRQNAVIENDTTMVPFRDIFESLNAYVDWIPSTKSIIAVRGVTYVKLQINSDKVYVNGEEKIIPAAPTLINDTTMVPLRAVSEILDSRVEWDGDTKTVSITTAKTDFEHNVKNGVYTKEYKDDNGELIMKTIALYPIFDGDEGIESINENYANFSQEMIELIGGQIYDSVKEQHDESGDIEFEPAVFIYSTETMYDKFDILSVVEQVGIGDGDIFYFDSATFNTVTGDLYSKDDFVNMSPSQAEMFEPYSFYLYGSDIIYQLNSDNIHLYQYNYPPAISVPQEYLKINLATGEEKDWTPLNDDNLNIQNPRVEYAKLNDLNKVLNFKMAEFKDQVRNIPVSYASIGDNIGEIVYSSNGGNSDITLRKGIGDTDLSGIYGAEKYNETLYNGSMIEFYKSDAYIYAAFAIEKENDIYSYSISSNDTSDMYYLIQLAKDIVDSEK